MSWDPFLMKVLLKKRFVGSVNSARNPLRSIEMHFSMKKSVKRKRTAFQQYPNKYLAPF